MKHVVHGVGVNDFVIKLISWHNWKSKYFHWNCFSANLFLNVSYDNKIATHLVERNKSIGYEICVKYFIPHYDQIIEIKSLFLFLEYTFSSS